VTGVSGSGKSTLINQTLLPASDENCYGSKVKAGLHKVINGAAKIDKVIEIDQSPHWPHAAAVIPATYTGAL